ncbi:MAG TPA: DNA recombination protein RmuC, partial [Rhodanobacteraceae bacterium]|nr:DNA recombination protein RmuC [Rhodanobacteraceae bacterium]
MPNLTPFVASLVGVVAGILVATLIAWLVARRREAQAHAAGRTSRDGEIAVLAEQRSAAVARADELSRRVERFEREVETSARTLRESAAHAAAQQARAERLESDLAEARRIRDGLQHRLDALSASHAALEASSREQLQAATEKLALLDQAEQRLRDSFQNLAASILDDKAKHLREQSEQQLGGLLDPLKLQLREFRETVTQTHASDQRERGMLAQEIQSLKQLNQRISEDAINLTRALKGDSRTQGAWGELVLERVLEASGLSAGRDYETQVTFRNDDGSRPRPDVIVRLPDNKDIVVDSK